MPKRNDNIKKKEREIGASLPDDLKKEYKEHFYKEQERNFDRKSNIMREMRNSMNDFKNQIKSTVTIDHAKAKEEADIRKNEKLERKIRIYIKEKGLKINEVKIISKAGNIQIMYVNQSGEIIRENVDISTIKEEIV